MRHRHRPLGLLGVVLAVSLSVVFTAGIATAKQCLFSRIVFSITRDNPPPADPRFVGEIYLMDPDGTHLTRLTENTGGSNVFADVAPDGKKIVFETNRLLAEGEPRNTADLFVMNTDGTEQTHLTRKDQTEGPASSASRDWAHAVSHVRFARVSHRPK